MTTKQYMPPIRENPRPTIDDIASVLGMHKATVSKGLSGKGTIAAATRDRILKVANAMGYEPNPDAQRLANKGNNKLVYLCAFSLDVGIGMEKIILIQRQLRQLGWEVPIQSLAQMEDGEQTSADPDHTTHVDEIRALCRQQPRAIIFNAHRWDRSVLPELQRYQESGGIVISYDSPVPLNCDKVIFDRTQNAYLAAKYLIERGHRRLGINLTYEPALANGAKPDQRVTGFLAAVEEAGLVVNRQCFFGPGAYEQGGEELAEHFLAMTDRPTGLCIVNDYSALAFMAEVRAAGLQIPRDVSIIGLDNQAVARYCPVPLTSAIQPVEEIAQAVVDFVVTRLEGRAGDTRTMTITSEIIERKSVASI